MMISQFFSRIRTMFSDLCLIFVWSFFRIWKRRTTVSLGWTPAYAGVTTPGLSEPVQNEAVRPTKLVFKILQHAKAEMSTGAVVFSSLCQPCGRVFRGAIPAKELGNACEHSLGQTLCQLEASAQQTCHLCRIRWSQISSADLEKLSQERDIKYGYWEARTGNGIAFDYPAIRLQDKYITKSVALLPAMSLRGTMQSMLIRKAESTFLTSMNKSSTRSSSSMNSPSSMISILAWIECCKTHHAKCSAMSMTQDRRLPTRLIDIGTGSTIRPVLRLTSHLPTSTLYVALSHCWGDSNLKFLTLRRCNLQLLQYGIDVSQLSKTFRDAMEVTWRLGLRYIWIDSLCIIQDDDRDWAHEASRMADVYSYAYLTIAATAAKDGNFGLFQERSRAHLDPCLIDVQWLGYERSVYICYGYDWNREVEEQPLLSRAWAVQERILSPRIVHFCRGQLYWECRELRADETYPEKLPSFRGQKPDVLPSDDQGTTDNEHGRPDHKIWKNAVQLYSRADLTYKTKDKLIAISGIARRLNISPTEYLAGLWRTGLTQQLLWSVDRHNCRGLVPVRSVEYRAPTWSWASIDGGVLIQLPTFGVFEHTHIEILDASTKLVDPNQVYGQVSEGVLRLRCMLATAPVSQIFVCRNIETSLRDGILVEEPLSFNFGCIIRAWLFLRNEHVAVTLDEGNGNVPIGLPFTFLPVRRERNDSYRGLVIKSTGRKRGEYRRIGYFEVLPPLLADHDRGSDLLALCRAFPETKEDESSYEDEAGTNDDGIPRYIITLV